MICMIKAYHPLVHIPIFWYMYSNCLKRIVSFKIICDTFGSVSYINDCCLFVWISLSLLKPFLHPTLKHIFNT
jgi:hypothetical protein